MIIKSNWIPSSDSLTEAETLVSQLYELTEAESDYRPEMVPVIQNEEIDANLMRLEDLSEYALSNGIIDAGYAVQSVCESNDIDMNSLVFTVNEESLFEDPDMVDTVLGFINEDAPVLVVPYQGYNQDDYVEE